MPLEKFRKDILRLKKTKDKYLKAERRQRMPFEKFRKDILRLKRPKDKYFKAERRLRKPFEKFRRVFNVLKSQKINNLRLKDVLECLSKNF
jgi:hypothetical protein